MWFYNNSIDNLKRRSRKHTGGWFNIDKCSDLLFFRANLSIITIYSKISIWFSGCFLNRYKLKHEIKKTYFVNANLVWNLWCDSKIQIYLVYMFLIYQIHEMQTMRLNRKSLLQIIYLNSFWIQPVNAIRIMLVFTLLVQNYSICKIILFILNIYHFIIHRYLIFRIFRNSR